MNGRKVSVSYSFQRASEHTVLKSLYHIGVSEKNGRKVLVLFISGCIRTQDVLTDLRIMFFLRYLRTHDVLTERS